MKTFKKIWILWLFASLVSNLAVPSETQAQAESSVSFQTFYDELEPYGRWINHQDYGYVWAPNVGAYFQPYATNGHWVITEYGNTWVSDYAWGWAPFHYGRWFYDDFDGWVWVPGSEWGPAWVSWRSGSGYYGWAPLGPNMSIQVIRDIPYNYWVFVPEIYITSRRVYTYCVPRPRVVNIYRNSIYINNIYQQNRRDYVYGPRREEIERATRSRVAVHNIEEMTRPDRTQVRNNAVSLYRPNVSNNRREAYRPRSIEKSAAINRNNYPDDRKSNLGNQEINTSRERYSRNNSNQNFPNQSDINRPRVERGITNPTQREHNGVISRNNSAQSDRRLNSLSRPATPENRFPQQSGIEGRPSRRLDNRMQPERSQPPARQPQLNQPSQRIYQPPQPRPMRGRAGSGKE